MLAREFLHWLPYAVVEAAAFGWPRGAMEAQAFVTLAARRENNPAMTFPVTAGVPKLLLRGMRAESANSRSS